jgi:hypothetical protein
MCIAILNAGKRIKKDKLSNSWHNNDDGAGILYIADGTLVAEKFPNDGDSNANFELFYARYLEVHSKYGDLPMLIHFRIATHGLTPEYLHPFFVSDTVGFVHNGIIYGLGSKDKSDTSDFADLLSTLVVPSVATLDNPFIDESIYRFIEDSSKLIFLDNTGDYRIFNEGLGHWVGENWFSNGTHNYKPLTKWGKWNDGFGYASTSGGHAVKYDSQYWDDIEDGRAMYPYDKDYDTYSAEDFDYDAPFSSGEYKCGECDTVARVNFNSECTTCGCYVPSAVDDVMHKLELLETKNIQNYKA